MRLAFLGCDESTPGLLRAALADGRFDVVGVCEFGDADDESRALAARLRAFDVWEALLDDEHADAVVVARAADEDRRAEQLRKLIQTGRPLAASHPVVDSMLLYYELDMIRRETHAVVLPALAERHHPAVRALAEMVRAGSESAAAGPIGKVEQLSFERSLAEPTKHAVERQFARDVDLVRAVAGEMTKLGAMNASGQPQSYASLGVQMSGPAGVAARWSVVPAAGNAGAKITLGGSRGRATVELAAPGEPWTLDLAADGETRRQEFAGWDASRAALDNLLAAVSGAAVEPGWVDACRSVELAETIERSLQKARTIELYYEDYTEEGTFKGTMTSIGCGLLVAAMLLLGVVGLADQVNLPLVRFWPYALVAILGVFLLLQLVMLTSGKRDAGSQAAADGQPPAVPPR